MILDVLACSRAIELIEALHRSRGFVEVGYNESRLTVENDLRNRAPADRDHGNPAGHRFDHAQAERLIEADQMKERIRTRKDLGALVGAY